MPCGASSSSLPNSAVNSLPNEEGAGPRSERACETVLVREQAAAAPGAQSRRLAAYLEGLARLRPSRQTRDCQVAEALGDVYYRLNRLDEARDALRTALSVDLSTPEAHNNLGVVLLAQGKIVAAQAEFREAIRHRPDYGAAHANLARLLAKGKAYDEATYHHAQDLRFAPATL